MGGRTALTEALLAEAVRVYGYPVELRKGAMGCLVSGRFGGQWVVARGRAQERRAWRTLLSDLRGLPSMPAWKPWTVWAAKGS